MITIKSAKEIDLMRKAGEITALALQKVGEAVVPGVMTAELDKIAEETIRKNGAIPSFKGYPGYAEAKPFPGAICASVNEEVIHGIPGSRVLKEGDIISVDTGAIYRGYHGDAARTFAVGMISEKAAKLIQVTRESFFRGIGKAVAGNRIAEISAAVQEYVEKNGFSVVRDYVGHGIGAEMHEEPQIPNFAVKAKGPRMEQGMTLAVEPMVNEGGSEVRTLDNLWTVVTEDGSLSAHYENTIVITRGKAIILTVLDN
ncbi:MAG: type I methionyl aminopeptidase [Eubacteriales bacterium]|nr:type I methionyl aminopeptidase [Eubacteriales bacterium]